MLFHFHFCAKLANFGDLETLDLRNTSLNAPLMMPSRMYKKYLNLCNQILTNYVAHMSLGRT